MISIIICTRNKEPGILEKTLRSIFSQKFLDLEVIVIDQNQDKKVNRLISQLKRKYSFQNLLYFKSEKIGLSRGRNLGLKKIKGNWILFFDDDAILPSNFFKKIRETLKEVKEGKIIFYGNVLNIEDGSPYIKRSIKTPQLHLWNFDSVCSIGLLFNRKVIDEVGYFDENFGIGSKFEAGEEADIIIRALKKGCKIKYLKDFVVYHPKPTPDTEKKYTYGYGLGALYKKHLFSSPKSFLVLGIKFIGEIVVRTILGISYFFINYQKAKLHINYLKGFLEGFIHYPQ